MADVGVVTDRGEAGPEQAGSGASRPTCADLLAATLQPALHEVFVGERRAALSDVDGISPWADPEHAFQLSWSAAAADVRESLPRLWELLGPRFTRNGTAGPCVELVVDVDALGRVVAVDLEAVPVGEVLAALGDQDGSAVAAQVVGQRAEVAGPAITDLLERAFTLGRHDGVTTEGCPI